jgi:DNA end-binding protein Ku
MWVEMQTVWKGQIAFGLVSIPVKLVSATEEKDISFRQVHAADGGRIKYKRVCSVDGEEVPYRDIAKGYELTSEEMVILTDQDFADLPIASNKSVEVVNFVTADELDPIAFSRPYFVQPTSDPKPYVLLRDTLTKTNKVAIVKVALRQRERLATLRPYDGALVLQTMLWPDEVREAPVSFDDADVNLRPQELEMASTYVEALTEDYDPEQFHDQYREALNELVQAKVSGRQLTAMPQPESAESNVVDLVKALQASLDSADKDKAASGGSRNRPTKKSAAKTTKAPGRKAAATKAAAKTTKKTAKKPAKKTAATRRTA